MNEFKRLRQMIREFEDKKSSAAHLGREVLHLANQLSDEYDGPLRHALVRLGHRFVTLAERSLHDDVSDELRGSVDDLHAELAGY